MFTSIMNALLDLIVLILTGLTALLPNTPFQFQPVEWGVFADVIGLVFPVSDIFTHWALIIAAFGSYYAVRWGLRLIRQVR